MLKNTKIVMISVLLLLIASIGVSFAVVTTSLDIKGKMKMGSANWDVHFENLSNPTINGSTIEIDKPYIADKSTSILNMNVKLQDVNDSVSYSFDVVNKGGLDAEVSSIQIASPNCSGSGDQANEDANNVCKNIGYELTYENGSKINIGDSLNVNEKKNLKLKLSYKGSHLPLNEVDVNNLSIAIIYTQK